jgi:hypothetical protein
MSEENQPERPNATALDVALWMQEQVNQKYLYHSSAYFQIIQIFGNEFAYTKKGSITISPAVLKLFDTLTSDTVVFAGNGRGRHWRKRADYDVPGQWKQR